MNKKLAEKFREIANNLEKRNKYSMAYAIRQAIKESCSCGCGDECECKPDCECGCNHEER